MSSYGLLADFRCPKVSKGERREAGIQWIQPPKAVSDPEFRQTTSGAHGSANRADCLPRGKPFGAPAGAYLLPRGADAPTTARGGTCSSIGLLICTGRRSKGLQGASGKPTVSINVRQLCRKETDSGGLTRRLRRIDAPTPARTVGLPPRRGTYFLSKRKKVPKKAGGTATTKTAHVAARRGLRPAGAERLDAPNLFGASNSGP